ncbi:hypothetical protein VM98_35245, partial [Streptomyces rubellomurinus subsp. indigoferus]
LRLHRSTGTVPRGSGQQGERALQRGRSGGSGDNRHQSVRVSTERDSLHRLNPAAGVLPSARRAGQKVAGLDACAPGELARFVPGEESPAEAGDCGSLSLFSRAVRELPVSHEGPLQLG